MGKQLPTLGLLFHILLMMVNSGSGTRVMLGTHLLPDTDSNGNEAIKALDLHTTHGDATSVMHENIKIHDEIIRLPRDDRRSYIPSMETDDEHGVVHEHAHRQTTHHGHMDSFSKVFLIEKNLKVGYTMPVYFPRVDPSSSPHFLAREEADSIPFSSAQLPYLLQMFSFSSTSSQAKAMGDTLRQCELEPITGETKSCATSLESMLEFTSNRIGMGSQFKVVTTIHHRQSTPTFQGQQVQNYTILDAPMEIFAPKMVACHTMPYPYAVFYCHYQESKTKVFMVSLIGENREKVEAVVVCHTDTSAWDPDHISFRELHIKPGTATVCHFFPEDHLVWVPLPSSV